MFDPRFPFQSPVLPGGQGWPAPPPAKSPSTTAPGTIPAAPAQQQTLPIPHPLARPVVAPQAAPTQPAQPSLPTPPPAVTPPAAIPASNQPEPPPGPAVAPAPAPKPVITATPAVVLADGNDNDVLAHLLGSWSGTGFNAIWVPNTAHGHFLMLDLTKDVIKFDDIKGPIPNRDLLQPDINMRGITYFQQIRSADTDNTMHIEPGLWVTVPETAHPHVPSTVVRIAAIPHGTSILAQGAVSFGNGSPTFAANDIIAFAIGLPSARIGFEESDLTKQSDFRSVSHGITQDMINNPNSLLQSACQGLQISHFIKFDITTDSSVTPGGGVANTAFLQGAPGEAPNALAQRTTSTFWIEFFNDAQGKEQAQIQYSQTVLLNFNGLSWPHVSVGTLRRAA